MFLVSENVYESTLAARGRQDPTVRARFKEERCEALQVPGLRSLHQLWPPCDARPEYPLPLSPHIRRIELLRRPLSFDLQWHR